VLRLGEPRLGPGRSGDCMYSRAGLAVSVSGGACIVRSSGGSDSRRTTAKVLAGQIIGADHRLAGSVLLLAAIAEALGDRRTSRPGSRTGVARNVSNIATSLRALVTLAKEL
jgi:hypothetical protein